jgi:hypothetical protein
LPAQEIDTQPHSGIVSALDSESRQAICNHQRALTMNGQALYSATEYYRPFPEPRDVFADRIDEHVEYLLPVGTLSLQHLSPEWSGELHIVLPIEPVGGYGYLGERSEAYHNYLCRANWLGYFIRDNRIRLACDFRYFHKAYYAENPPDDEVYAEEAAELPSHYADTRQQFAACAAHFRQHGWLCADPEKWSPERDPEMYRRTLVQDLGGVSFDGNWSCDDDGFPFSRYPDQYEDRGKMYECERVLPRTEDGRDFVYIGEVENWNYIGQTNGMLVVFYDPKDQIVLTTIDWT